MLKADAKGRARELGGIAVTARWSNSLGKWITDGFKGWHNEWIVVSADGRTVLDDDGRTVKLKTKAEDTTSRIYALLLTDNPSAGNFSQMWESCSRASAEDFERDARRILGDKTEVTGHELRHANWAALLQDFREMAEEA